MTLSFLLNPFRSLGHNQIWNTVNAAFRDGIRLACEYDTMQIDLVDLLSYYNVPKCSNFIHLIWFGRKVHVTESSFRLCLSPHLSKPKFPDMHSIFASHHSSYNLRLNTQ